MGKKRVDLLSIVFISFIGLSGVSLWADQSAVVLESKNALLSAQKEIDRLEAEHAEYFDKKFEQGAQRLNQNMDTFNEFDYKSQGEIEEEADQAVRAIKSSAEGQKEAFEKAYTQKREDVEAKYHSDVAAAQTEYETTRKDIEETYRAKIGSLKKTYQITLQEALDQRNDQFSQLKTEKTKFNYDNKIDYENRLQDLQDQLAQKKITSAQYKQGVSDSKKKYERADDQADKKYENDVYAAKVSYNNKEKAAKVVYEQEIKDAERLLDEGIVRVKGIVKTKKAELEKKVEKDIADLKTQLYKDRAVSDPIIKKERSQKIAEKLHLKTSPLEQEKTRLKKAAFDRQINYPRPSLNKIQQEQFKQLVRIAKTWDGMLLEQIKKTIGAADIRNYHDKNRSVLHYAIAYGFLPLVEYLLSKGIPVNETDRANKTALDYAQERGYLDERRNKKLELIVFLKSKDGRSNSVDALELSTKMKKYERLIEEQKKIRDALITMEATQGDNLIKRVQAKEEIERQIYQDVRRDYSTKKLKEIENKLDYNYDKETAQQIIEKEVDILRRGFEETVQLMEYEHRRAKLQLQLEGKITFVDEGKQRTFLAEKDYVAYKSNIINKLKKDLETGINQAYAKFYKTKADERAEYLKNQAEIAKGPDDKSIVRQVKEKQKEIAIKMDQQFTTAAEQEKQKFKNEKIRLENEMKSKIAERKKQFEKSKTDLVAQRAKLSNDSFNSQLKELELLVDRDVKGIELDYETRINNIKRDMSRIIKDFEESFIKDRQSIDKMYNQSWDKVTQIVRGNIGTLRSKFDIPEPEKNWFEKTFMTVYTGLTAPLRKTFWHAGSFKEWWGNNSGFMVQALTLGMPNPLSTYMPGISLFTGPGAMQNSIALSAIKEVLPEDVQRFSPVPLMNPLEMYVSMYGAAAVTASESKSAKDFFSRVGNMVKDSAQAFVEDASKNTVLFVTSLIVNMLLDPMNFLAPGSGVAAGVAENIGETIAREGVEVFVKEGLEATTQYATKKLAEEFAETSAEKVAQKIVQATIEKTAQEGAEGLAKKSAMRLNSEIVDAARRLLKEATNNAAETAVSKASKEVIEQVGKEVAQETAEQLAKETAKQIAQGATKDVAELTAKKVAQEATQTTVSSATSKVITTDVSKAADGVLPIGNNVDDIGKNANSLVAETASTKKPTYKELLDQQVALRKAEFDKMPKSGIALEDMDNFNELRAQLQATEDLRIIKDNPLSLDEINSQAKELLEQSKAVKSLPKNSQPSILDPLDDLYDNAGDVFGKKVRSLDIEPTQIKHPEVKKAFEKLKARKVTGEVIPEDELVAFQKMFNEKDYGTYEALQRSFVESKTSVKPVVKVDPQNAVDTFIDDATRLSKEAAGKIDDVAQEFTEAGVKTAVQKRPAQPAAKPLNPNEARPYQPGFESVARDDALPAPKALEVVENANAGKPVPKEFKVQNPSTKPNVSSGPDDAIKLTDEFTEVEGALDSQLIKEPRPSQPPVTGAFEIPATDLKKFAEVQKGVEGIRQKVLNYMLDSYEYSGPRESYFDLAKNVDFEEELFKAALDSKIARHMKTNNLTGSLDEFKKMTSYESPQVQSWIKESKKEIDIFKNVFTPNEEYGALSQSNFKMNKELLGIKDTDIEFIVKEYNPLAKQVHAKVVDKTNLLNLDPEMSIERRAAASARAEELNKKSWSGKFKTQKRRSKSKVTFGDTTTINEAIPATKTVENVAPAEPVQIEVVTVKQVEVPVKPVQQPLTIKGTTYDNILPSNTTVIKDHPEVIKTLDGVNTKLKTIEAWVNRDSLVGRNTTDQIMAGKGYKRFDGSGFKIDPLDPEAFNKLSTKITEIKDPAMKKIVDDIMPTLQQDLKRLRDLNSTDDIGKLLKLEQEAAEKLAKETTEAAAKKAAEEAAKLPQSIKIMTVEGKVRQLQNVVVIPGSLKIDHPGMVSVLEAIDGKIGKMQAEFIKTVGHSAAQKSSLLAGKINPLDSGAFGQLDNLITMELKTLGIAPEKQTEILSKLSGLKDDLYILREAQKSTDINKFFADLAAKKVAQEASEKAAREAAQEAKKVAEQKLAQEAAQAAAKKAAEEQAARELAEAALKKEAQKTAEKVAVQKAADIKVKLQTEIETLKKNYGWSKAVNVDDIKSLEDFQNSLLHERFQKKLTEEVMSSYKGANPTFEELKKDVMSYFKRIDERKLSSLLEDARRTDMLKEIFADFNKHVEGLRGSQGLPEVFNPEVFKNEIFALHKNHQSELKISDHVIKEVLKLK